MSNRLAKETSPYLLQHRDNPVDWYPWGDDALALARSEDRPILLSVGYSSCHWCHVMERESFEDPETAEFMNRHFVNVKVDREERPDVDALYMEAVQGMTGRGGWPMTVFLDPEGVPFYAGTYFPPEPAHGMPSFRQVMEAVSQAFGERREEIRASAPRTRAQLGAIGEIEPSAGALEPGVLDDAVAGLRRQADPVNGGFGGAPKFPPASALEFLLARGVDEIVERTLDAMAGGGIYDQIGGGFSRYSVDAVWLVPHFEKMLYDNALLARCYLHGWQALGHERYRRVCTETLDWALREMRGPEGGFFSALDADSEGVEGRFYVWSRSEIEDLLGERAEAVISHLGVTEGGNFEGANVLHLPGGAASPTPQGFERGPGPALRGPLEADTSRPGRQAPDRLERADDQRPGRGRGGARPRRLPRGGGAAARISSSGSCATPRGACCAPTRTARRSWRPTSRTTPSCSRPCWRSMRPSFEQRWFEQARAVAEALLARFSDPERGGFFTTGADQEPADRPPQGDRRSPDPLRQLLGRARPAAARRAERRAPLRA